MCDSRFYQRIARCLVAVAVLSDTSHGASPPAQVYVLVWSDEFDGPNGSSLDAKKWVHETGGDGWGNQELETYTARSENSQIKDGNLVITARKEDFTGADGTARHYTSARIKTQGLFEQVYGRMEARIKIPAGQGMWPAFWMLGNDITSTGWPGSGEIDIMENIGKEPATIHGTIHGPGFSGAGGLNQGFSVDHSKVEDDFAVFAVEWEPNKIRFYCDSVLYVTRTPAALPAGGKWVFDHPFFLILNLAVGGGWPGNPDSSTNFPQSMLVDYVRVYAKSGASAPQK